MTEIPDFARAQAETGPLQAANQFLDAIQVGDVAAACEVSVPAMAARLRTGLAEELRAKWSDVDDAWGWTATPKPIGIDLEHVMLVDKGETGYVEEATEVTAIHFIMQHIAGAWRVYALAPPEA